MAPRRTPPPKTRRRKRTLTRRGREEEESSPPLDGEDKKRKAAPSGEAEGSKKGRTLLPDYSTIAAYSNEEWLLRDKPLAKS